MWLIKFNGITLREIFNVSEPYKTPYKPVYGKAINYRAWIVPKKILKNGNRKNYFYCNLFIEIVMPPSRIRFWPVM